MGGSAVAKSKGPVIRGERSRGLASFPYVGGRKLTSCSPAASPMPTKAPCIERRGYRKGLSDIVVLASQLEAMTKDIREMDSNRLLNTSPEDLARYFSEKYRIDVPMLIDESISADQREVRLDRTWRMSWNAAHQRFRPWMKRHYAPIFLSN